MLTSGLWTDYASSSLGGGGTSTNPYLITSAEDLAKMATMINSSTTYRTKYFKLSNDIDLTDHYWVPIGKSSTYCFAGYFDGGGHSISNLTYNSNYYATEDAGLFGYVNTISNSNPTIKNVRLKGCSFNGIASLGVRNIGALIGTCIGYTGPIISNISTSLADPNVNGNTRVYLAVDTDVSCNVGLLVGKGKDCSFEDIFINVGNITLVSTLSSLTTTTYCGGIIGLYQNALTTNQGSAGAGVVAFKDINIYDLRVYTTHCNSYSAALCGCFSGGTTSSGYYHHTIESIFINDGYVHNDTSNNYANEYISGFIGKLEPGSEQSSPYINAIRINELSLVSGNSADNCYTIVASLGEKYPQTNEYGKDIYVNVDGTYITSDMDSGFTTVNNGGVEYNAYDWNTDLNDRYHFNDLSSTISKRYPLSCRYDNTDGTAYGLWDDKYPVVLSPIFREWFSDVKPMYLMSLIDFSGYDLFGYYGTVVYTNGSFAIPKPLYGYYDCKYDLYQGDTIFWSGGNGDSDSPSTLVSSAIESGLYLSFARNMSLWVADGSVVATHGVTYKNEDSSTSESEAIYYKTSSSTLAAVESYCYKDEDGILI